MLSTNAWTNYKRIKINATLFEKGIIVIFPKEMENKNQVTERSFEIGEREFHFFDPNHPQKEDDSHIRDDFRKALSSLKVLGRHYSNLGKNLFIDEAATTSACVYNKSRREEIFLPLSLNDKGKQVGFYVWPWSSSANRKFTMPASGIKQYVTAGCLFGSSIQGRDQCDAIQSLIKHDGVFFTGQKIETVMTDVEFSPYEIMLFHQMKNIACLINTLGGSKNLLYHLPYYDYILFGIKLYIQDRITREALNVFFEQVFLRKNMHQEEIIKICTTYTITVEFESPFENIFGLHQAVDQVTFAQFIFATFPLFLSESVTSPKTEKELSVFCLEELTGEDKINSVHSKIWEDFKKTGTESINGLEDLFKIANAIIVASASVGHAEYETLSLLPITEKPIQLAYKKFIETCNASAPSTVYKNVIYLTLLDSVVTYFRGKSHKECTKKTNQESNKESNKDGLLFYYHHRLEPGSVSEFMSPDILSAASENVVAQPPIKLDQLLLPT